MPDAEINAMTAVAAALGGLDGEGQRRVLAWAADRFSVQLSSPRPIGNMGKPPAPGSGSGGDEEDDEDDANGSEFAEFADLFNAAGSPAGEPEKALLAAYWVQTLQGGSNFQSQQLNTLLKNLGHPIGNITNSMTSLISRKPGLVMQTKKSGTSQQARKTFKLTHEGTKAVQAMLR